MKYLSKLFTAFLVLGVLFFFTPIPYASADAIAFGAFTQTSGSGATVTTSSVTVSGSNTIGIVCTQDVDNNATSSITATWNGSSMTQSGFQLSGGGGVTAEIFYITNPTTGAIAVTRATHTTTVLVYATYYTGAAQTAPEANSQLNNPSTTSFTQNITTVSDNDWIAWCVRGNNNNLSAGANTTLRGAASNNQYADTNAAQTPAGSKSMNVASASASFVGVQAAFAPFTAPAVTPNFGNLFFFGWW